MITNAKDAYAIIVRNGAIKPGMKLNKATEYDNAYVFAIGRSERSFDAPYIVYKTGKIARFLPGAKIEPMKGEPRDVSVL